MSTHIPPKEGSNLIPKKNPARTDDQDRQTKPLMVPSLSVARLSAVPLKPLPLPLFPIRKRTAEHRRN